MYIVVIVGAVGLLTAIVSFILFLIFRKKPLYRKLFGITALIGLALFAFAGAEFLISGYSFIDAVSGATHNAHK